MSARVEQLLCDQHELVLPKGQRLRYDRLLLATGALAVPPTFPGGSGGLPGLGGKLPRLGGGMPGLPGLGRPFDKKK